MFLKHLAASAAEYCGQGAVDQSAASAASPDSVKSQAVVKSAASAASLRGGRASGRLDHGLFLLQFFRRASAQKNSKKINEK